MSKRKPVIRKRMITEDGEIYTVVLPLTKASIEYKVEIEFTRYKGMRELRRLIREAKKYLKGIQKVDEAGRGWRITEISHERITTETIAKKHDKTVQNTEKN